MKRYAWLSMLVAAFLPFGCVTRQFVVYSDPPGAMVYVNGKQLGLTPVEDHFIHYGRYHFRLVKDGYETKEDLVDFIIPWYEYPGIDFVSEIVNPCKIRDIRRLQYFLTPLQPVRAEDVQQRANELRDRGQQIQPIPAPPPVSIPARQPGERTGPFWGLFGPGVGRGAATASKNSPTQPGATPQTTSQQTPNATGQGQTSPSGQSSPPWLDRPTAAPGGDVSPTNPSSAQPPASPYSPSSPGASSQSQRPDGRLPGAP
jgi:PEGA domain